MEKQKISIRDREEIRNWFGAELEMLDKKVFEQRKKELMAKYHPDKFERFADDTIRELATEKFQRLQEVIAKIEAFFTGQVLLTPGEPAGYRHHHARFAAKKLKVEIITQDKDLKYHLFGSYYRWLTYGETFKIPDTSASIVMDEDHQGHRIGFRESIRLYLTFDEDQSIEDIVNWLYSKIVGRASYLIVSKDKVEILPEKMVVAIQKVSFLRIEGP